MVHRERYTPTGCLTCPLGRHSSAGPQAVRATAPPSYTHRPHRWSGHATGHSWSNFFFRKIHFAWGKRKSGSRPYKRAAHMHRCPHNCSHTTCTPHARTPVRAVSPITIPTALLALRCINSQLPHSYPVPTLHRLTYPLPTLHHIAHPNHPAPSSTPQLPWTYPTPLSTSDLPCTTWHT